MRTGYGKKAARLEEGKAARLDVVTALKGRVKGRKKNGLVRAEATTVAGQRRRP